MTSSYEKMDITAERSRTIEAEYQSLCNSGKLEDVAKAQNVLDREIMKICKEFSKYPEELYALIKSKI